MPLLAAVRSKFAGWQGKRQRTAAVVLRAPAAAAVVGTVAVVHTVVRAALCASVVAVYNLGSEARSSCCKLCLVVAVAEEDCRAGRGVVDAAGALSFSNRSKPPAKRRNDRNTLMSCSSFSDYLVIQTLNPQARGRLVSMKQRLKPFVRSSAANVGN